MGGFKTLLSAIGPVTIAIGAMVGVMYLAAKASGTYKDAAKEAKASAQAYEDSAAKVKSLEDELNDVSAKIDEINKKDKIDPMDREALNNLNETKASLEEQLALEKKLAEYRQGQAAKDARKAIDKGGNEAWDWQSMFGIKGVEDVDFATAGAKLRDTTGVNGQKLWDYDQITETSAMQNAVERLTKERQSLEDSYRMYIDSMTESEKKANRSRVEEIDDLVATLGDSIAQNVTDLNGYLDSITDADGNALKGYEDYVFRIEQLQHQISGIDVNPLDDAAAHVKEFQQLAKDGNWDSAELRHYIGLLSGQDLSTADVDKVKEAWNGLKQTIGNSDWNVFNFLKGDETENLQQFWEAVQSINKEWASFDSKTGEWTINLTSVEALAEALGLSEDLVKSIIQKTSEAGIDIDTTPVDNVRHAIMETSEALDVLKAKKVDIDFNLDAKTVQEAEQSIDHVAKYIASLRDDKGKLNLDSQEVQAAYTIMSQLYDKKIELSNSEDITFKVNTEGISDDKVKTFINDINNAKLAIQELNKGKKLKAQGFDIDVGALKKKAQEAVGKVKESFKELPEDKKVKLSIKEEGVDQEHLGKTLKVLKKINEADCKVALGIDPALVEGYNPDDKEAEVKYSANYSAVTNSKPPTMQGTVKYYSDYTNDRPHPGTNTRTHYQGNANASGTWGSDHDGDDLVGELGRELLVNVRTGRWQTIGDNGAEFTHVGKGDIIFNHKQTEQLLKYGHINSRGHALASGNAYDIGITGKGVLGKPKPKDDDKPDKSTGNHVKTAATTVAKSVKDATDSIEKDTKNLVDWVEKVLENIDKKTEKYLAKAEKKAEAGNYSGAAKQYQKALNTYDKSIGKHGDAENLYMRQANSALSKAISSGAITKEMAATIQKRVANGAMDISKLSDGTKAVVDAYKEYYDKAVAAQEATQELYDKYEETAKKMYQLPLDQASAKTDKLKNSFDILEKKLDVTTSAARRQSLMEEELTNLRQQHAAVSKAYGRATDNYRTAKRRVNETTDSALSGLSGDTKAQVVAKVKKNLVIDVTALTGLTAAGKQAIIDYNASLVAQQDAHHDLQVSSLETAASIKELSASIANIPNEVAEARIDRIHDREEVIDAKYAIADTATERNRLLGKSTKKAWNELDARDNAVTDIQDEIDNRFAGAVKRAAKAQGKSRGETLSLDGYDKKSKEYKAISEYNAFIAALPEAQRQATLAWANAIKVERENSSKMFENIKTDAENGKKSIIDAANDIDDAYGELDASAVKLITANPSLTYDQAIMQVMGNAQTKYENAAAAYKNMANTLRAWLKQNADKMSAEDIAAAEEVIASYDKNATAFTEKGQSVAKDVTAYNNGVAERNRDQRQRGYNDIHQKNELEKSRGRNLTEEEIQAEYDAMQALINADNDYIATQKRLRDSTVAGSDAWKTYNDNVESGTGDLISHTEALNDLSDARREAKNRPVDNEFAALQNEADKLQDSISLAQAAGQDASPTDYYKLIQNSRQQVELLRQKREELAAELATLDELDARYAEIQDEVWRIDDAIRQAEIDQAGWAKSATDSFTNGASGASDASSQIKETLENLAKRHLNDIKLRLEKLGAKLNDIYNRMDLLKAKGVTPGYQNYIDAYSVNRERMQELQKEIKDLEFEYKKLRTYDEDPDGSQRLAAYQEWQSAVQEYNKLMAENMELARVTLRDSLLKPLQDEHDRLEHIANIFAGIADIIDDDMLFNQDGTVSKYGNMKTDLLAGQYQAARSEVQNYMDDIKVVNKLIAAGYYSSEEGSVRLNELQEKLIGAMKNQKSLASDLAETLKQANEQEIDQLGKIIDARKEALQAKKDYYDYDKNIRAQTKDIQVLQAQIAALEGLGDAESKAKRAKLQAQLTEAQQNLDDTVREHMFEISQDSLDKLQDTLQQSFEEEWDELSHDLDALIKYANNLADNTDPSVIESAMRDVFGTFDVDSTLAQFDDYFNTMMEPRHRDPYDTAVYDTVLNNIYDALCQLRDMGALSNGINPEAIKDDVTAAAIAASNVNNGVNTPVVQEDGGSVPKGEAPIVKWFREVFEDIGNWFGTLKSKIKIPGFASGVRRVSKSQLAWTQERGKEEWIVRPSDGAILTPMTKGSGVLPPDATSKLWALAQWHLPTMQMPKMPTPNFDFSETISPVVNIDNSMTVEGSVDAAVIGDLKKFKEEQREDIYQYVSDRMFRGYIHSGGKRRI